MSDMKCPFCQTELDMDMMGEMGCPNDSCKKSTFMVGTKELWQALIQAKQDLAKAINVIDTVRQHKRGTAVIYPNDIAVYCDRALEQIEQKENQ